MNRNITPYVKSIYEIGKEEKLLPLYFKTCKDFLFSLKENEEILNYLADPNIIMEEKEEFLNKLFPTKNFTYFRNWLSILINARIIKSLNKIILNFIKLYNKENNIVEGIIWTTFPLGKVEISNITKIFKKKLNQDVFLENKLDNSIINGIKIEIGNDFWENNVLNSLNKMVEELLVR